RRRGGGADRGGSRGYRRRLRDHHEVPGRGAAGGRAQVLDRGRGAGHAAREPVAPQHRGRPGRGPRGGQRRSGWCAMSAPAGGGARRGGGRGTEEGGAGGGGGRHGAPGRAGERVSARAGRGAAWTEERATKERVTREGGASMAPRRLAREAQ